MIAAGGWSCACSKAATDLMPEKCGHARWVSDVVWSFMASVWRHCSSMWCGGRRGEGSVIPEAEAGRCAAEMCCVWSSTCYDVDWLQLDCWQILGEGIAHRWSFQVLGVKWSKWIRMGEIEGAGLKYKRREEAGSFLIVCLIPCLVLLPGCLGTWPCAEGSKCKWDSSTYVHH